MLGTRTPAIVLCVFLVACSGSEGAGGPSSSGTAGVGVAGAGYAGTGAGSAGSGGGAGTGGTGVGKDGGADAGGSAAGKGGSSGSAGGTPDAGLDASPSDAAGDVSFSTVQPILAMTCVRCHDPAHPFVPETTTYVAMDLTAKNAYSALVNKNATQMCGGKLVRPGDPAKSYLYAKITQDTPCFGQRMPHQGMLRTPPLPNEQIAIFERWISGGAKP